MTYGVDLLSDCHFEHNGATMADKGKALKKPTLTAKERRAEKRRKAAEDGEFLRKQKRS